MSRDLRWHRQGFWFAPVAYHYAVNGRVIGSIFESCGVWQVYVESCNTERFVSLDAAKAWVEEAVR